MNFAKFFIDSTLGSNGALVIRSQFQPRSGSIVPSKTGNANAAHRQYFEGVRNPSEIMRVSRQFSHSMAKTGESIFMPPPPADGCDRPAPGRFPRAWRHAIQPLHRRVPGRSDETARASRSE